MITQHPLYRPMQFETWRQLNPEITDTILDCPHCAGNGVVNYDCEGDACPGCDEDRFHPCPRCHGDGYRFLTPRAHYLIQQAEDLTLLRAALRQPASVPCHLPEIVA